VLYSEGSLPGDRMGATAAAEDRLNAVDLSEVPAGEAGGGR